MSELDDLRFPSIIGLYKSAVTRDVHRLFPCKKVWQTSFHDHIIRNEHSYQQIWNYIDHNPAKWEEDCFYTPQTL